MKKIVMLILFFCLFATAIYADEIHLNDGTIIKGKIIKITPGNIEYDPEGDVPFDIFPRGQIQKIVYDDGKTILLNEGKEIPAEEKKDSYYENNTDQAEQGTYAIHQHDDFYFRGIFGFGYGRFVVEDYPDNSATGTGEKADLGYSGTTFIFQLQAGYAVMENFILAISYGAYATGTGSTNVKWGDRNISDDEKKNTAVGTSFLGFGVTYYFMPINIYISGFLEVTATSYRGFPIDDEIAGGSGIELSVGKEWWISENWGIGISAFIHSNAGKYEEKTTKDEYNVRSVSYGIAFSATYN